MPRHGKSKKENFCSQIQATHIKAPDMFVPNLLIIIPERIKGFFKGNTARPTPQHSTIYGDGLGI